MTAYHLSPRHVAALAVAAALLAAAPVAAQADVLFDNLAANTDFSTDALGELSGPEGQAFNSGAFAVDLHNVQLLLINGDGNPKSSDNAGKLFVELFSDNSDTPGTLIATIGTLADSAISTSYAVYDVVLSSDIALTADTNYWVELVSNGPNAIAWGESDDLSGPGVDGTFISDPEFGTGSVDQAGVANQMLVETPEPPALPVFASALLLLGVALHRRARG